MSENNKRSKQDKLKKVSSAAQNMSALVDDIVKTARKSFKLTGETDLDAKFLKESVGALRELYELLDECNDEAPIAGGVIIRFDSQAEEWSK